MCGFGRYPGWVFILIACSFLNFKKVVFSQFSFGYCSFLSLYHAPSLQIEQGYWNLAYEFWKKKILDELFGGFYFLAPIHLLTIVKCHFFWHDFLHFLSQLFTSPLQIRLNGCNFAYMYHVDLVNGSDRYVLQRVLLFILTPLLLLIFSSHNTMSGDKGAWEGSRTSSSILK